MLLFNRRFCERCSNYGRDFLGRHNQSIKTSMRCGSPSVDIKAWSLWGCIHFSWYTESQIPMGLSNRCYILVVMQKVIIVLLQHLLLFSFLLLLTISYQLSSNLDRTPNHKYHNGKVNHLSGHPADAVCKCWAKFHLQSMTSEPRDFKKS